MHLKTKATIAASGAWQRIEPTDSCFGWVHKQFLKKLTALPQATPRQGPPEHKAPAAK